MPTEDGKVLRQNAQSPMGSRLPSVLCRLLTRCSQSHIPEQVVGRVVVTRVDEGHSTATIVNAESPIKVGDHISMSIE